MALNISYAEQLAAFAGMLADLTEKEAAPYVQGEASAEIPFGAGIAEGTVATESGGYVKGILPVDANSVFAGVLLHAHDLDPRTELGTTGVKPGAALSVLKEGRVWVYTEGTIAKGATLFWRHTVGADATLNAVGRFRADADTNKAIEVPVVALDGRTGAGLILVDVDVLAGKLIAQL